MSRLFPLVRIGAILALAALTLSLPRWLLRHRYADRIINPENAPYRPTAIILGAGLRRDGKPTAVLEDRVQTAVLLYRAGKVSTLLMSGADSARGDEPAAMRALAIEFGVADEDILVDQRGVRTFETCLRAAKVYGIDQAIIVTQSFHLPRALALCEAHDIKALGVRADLRTYRANTFWNLREIPASIRALWDVYKHIALDRQDHSELSS